jgi:hypothetical protein
MTLKNITDNSAIFTDEKFSEANLLSLAKKAIARINTECKTLFPFYNSINETYTALPDIWQLDLLSPYISYGIKMNDSSLSEADRYLDEFYRILNNFKDNLGALVDKYDQGDEINGISSEFIDNVGFGGVYGIDTSGAINIGFFGNNSNGGSF